MVLEAYKGTISSVILSVIVVGVLLVPFVSANYLEKVRRGEGKYEFKETIFWDIDDEDDFLTWDGSTSGQRFIPGPIHSDYMYGEGQFIWTYGVILESTWYRVGVYQPVTFSLDQIDGVVDEWVYAQMLEHPGEYGEVSGYPCTFNFIFTFNREFLIENDVTRVDIFLDTTLTDVDGVDCMLFDREDGVEYYHEFGEKVSIDISITDLLDLPTAFSYPEEEWLVFRAEFEEDYDSTGGVIKFDMQLYHVEEIKTPSIIWLGIIMVGVGTFMIFCSILMLPSIDFGGITKRLFKTEGGELK